MSESDPDEATSQNKLVFNADLLISEADERAVRRDYPLIADFVIWPELGDAFGVFEKAAVQSKARSRKRGFLAIRFALIALLVLSFTDLLQSALAWVLASLGIAVPSATYLSNLINHMAWGGFFLAGLWYANQSLYGKCRIAWLQPRACAERLRQFNFQFLIFWFDWITSDKPEDWQTVLDNRADALARASEAIEPERGVSLTALAHDIEHRSWRLVDGPISKPSGNADPGKVAELIQYMRAQRLLYQAAHARRMIDPEPGAGSPSIEVEHRRHRSALKRNTICFIVFQLVALALYFCDAISSWLTGWSGIVTLGGESLPFSALPALAQMIALAFATLVAAERVEEDGLHLRGDLARYRTYAGLMQRIENGVADAEAKWRSGDEAALSTVKQWLVTSEELAYWELRTFCEMHRESSFSL